MAPTNSPSTQSTSFFSILMTFGMEMNLTYDENAIPKDKKLGNNAKQHMNKIIENINLANDIAKQNIEKIKKNPKSTLIRKPKLQTSNFLIKS